MSKEYDKWLSQGLRIASKNNVKNKEEYASMYADFRQQAKIADQKMRRLEKLSTQENYKGVLQYAYARAKRDIKEQTGKDTKKMRFSANIPTTLKGLASYSKDVERFNRSESSTKQGITNIYKRRAETVNIKYGRVAGAKSLKAKKLAGWKDLTWQDLANYYEKEKNTKLDSKLGSSTQMKVLGRFKRLENKDKEQQAKDIQAVIDGSKKLSDDEIENTRIQMLAKSGLKPEDLFT